MTGGLNLESLGWQLVMHLGTVSSLPLKGEAKHLRKNDQMPLDCFSYASFKVISIIRQVLFFLSWVRATLSHTGFWKDPITHRVIFVGGNGDRSP